MRYPNPLSSYSFPELIIKDTVRSFSPEKQRKVLAELLRDMSVERLLSLLGDSGFLGYTGLIDKLILALLEERHLYETAAHFLEEKIAGQYYTPEIVKAAEYYERIGHLEKALDLYTKGLEVCSPSRIEVYDENTGGYVSALNHYDLNKKEIEEAVNLVKKCETKIEELKRRIQEKMKKAKGGERNAL